MVLFCDEKMFAPKITFSCSEWKKKKKKKKKGHIIGTNFVGLNISPKKKSLCIHHMINKACSHNDT